MIALAASVVLALYLLIPSGIFRLFFGFFVPLRSFVRTRGEEILQGVMSVVAPIVLALTLVWTVAPFTFHPFHFPDTPQFRRADYKLVVSAVYSEEVFRRSGDEFWKALTRTGRRQGRFLVWYYALAIAEGLLFGALSVSNPRLTGYRWYRWMFGKVLLPNISEWYVLLTPFFFQDKRTAVWADILCVDDTLYRGIVSQHSLTREGQLAGLILTEAKRYDRKAYLEDAEKGPVNKAQYWTPIPGAKLYIFANKILNLNLAYQGPEPSPEVMADLIARALRQKLRLTVQRHSPPEKQKPQS